MLITINWFLYKRKQPEDIFKRAITTKWNDNIKCWIIMFLNFFFYHYYSVYCTCASSLESRTAHFNIKISELISKLQFSYKTHTICVNRRQYGLCSDLWNAKLKLYARRHSADVTLACVVFVIRATDLKPPRLQHSKHALGGVEGMSPVVVDHILPVVLLYT